jgi:hypothetical protein
MLALSPFKLLKSLGLLLLQWRRKIIAAAQKSPPEEVESRRAS